MFPKVPCDRPTFAATRSYCVPPRTSRRACVLRRRARAWRMRRHGRNSSALRCVVAIPRPDVTRSDYTQACERRAREALVRAGAGFHDDRCTGEAGAAGRQPPVARRGRTGRLGIDGVEPVSGEISDLLAQAGGGGDVLIYVHGFKQTFETAVLDAAHLSDAIKFRGRTIAFSWPSKAGLFDYAYDRDSAMWSRDDFERVLSSILAAPGGGRAHIVAHSMGTMLTLESLRQLYARYYGETVAGRLGAVVFAAPDIDMDVFSSAINRIGPLAGKITVITATNDRALALSGQLAGGMTRVGAAEKAAIEQLGVRVIDASDTGWGIINHDLFLSNAEVRRVIRRSIDTAAA